MIDDEGLLRQMETRVGMGSFAQHLGGVGDADRNGTFEILVTRSQTFDQYAEDLLIDAPDALDLTDEAIAQLAQD